MVKLNTCILLVDDDAAFIEKVKKFLGPQYRIVSTTDSTAAVKYAVQYRPDLMLLDFNMPVLNGLDILRHLKQKMPFLPIIMLTAESKTDIVVEAIKSGADDYVVKGSDDFTESLRLRVGSALKLLEMQRENSELQTNLSRKFEIQGISPGTVKLRSEIISFKGSALSVLIRGENGTGKELVARGLHSQEGKSRPFVEINCGAIPKDLFESEFFGHLKGSFTGAVADRVGKFVKADKGDIFLDEIGDLPNDLQVKLLKVIEGGSFTAVGSDKPIFVKVRVIAATNKNLEHMVRIGTFREDLYYRLHQIEIKVPPLRERKQDILFLAKLFCDEYMPGMSMTKEAKEALEAHRWGGNIRELKNTIETACVKARGAYKIKIEPCHILLSDLGIGEEVPSVPADLLPRVQNELTPESYEKSLEWIQRAYLKKGLELTNDDNQSLMRILNLKKTDYYNKKKKLGLSEKRGGTVA